MSRLGLRKEHFVAANAGKTTVKVKITMLDAYHPAPPRPAPPRPVTVNSVMVLHQLVVLLAPMGTMVVLLATVGTVMVLYFGVVTSIITV